MRPAFTTPYLATVALAAAVGFAWIGNADLAQVLVGAVVGIVSGAATERHGTK